MAMGGAPAGAAAPRTAMIFFPLFLPCIIIELVRRSTIGHCAFLNRFVWYRPPVCEVKVANLGFTAM